MILNAIRNIKKKFSSDYGEVVICCDGRNLWRREAFPYYKANRKRDRGESLVDWRKIFEILNTVRDEIRDNFPYRVVIADGAEADDVIAVLTIENSIEAINNHNRILIVSGDKDFVQLQRYPNVEQYDPVKKKKIVNSDPKGFMRQHILGGDAGDGVPNVLSQDDSFVLGVKQRPLTAKKRAAWADVDPTEEHILRNLKRNELLIDLSRTPERVRSAVLESYSSQANKDKGKILGYIIKNRLGNLLDVAGDF